ncbi:MAG: 5-methyltetrahydropteroyltriglutamate--homocysteine S-methyltransferase, partial [Streptosporangiaceae bacterium]
MSVRTTPPFRADQVGSLLRPPILLRAREDAARGAISPDDLRAVEDDAIRDAVRMQDDIGLRSVTDGEFRRASWHMDFIYEIAGVQKAEQNLRSVFHNEAGDIEFTPSAIKVTGKLGMDQTIFGSAFEFLRDTAAALSPNATPKLTIPAPSLVHYRGGPAAIDQAVYPDIDVFWEDLGAAYADEV